MTNNSYRREEIRAAGIVLPEVPAITSEYTRKRANYYGTDTRPRAGVQNCKKRGSKESIIDTEAIEGSYSDDVLEFIRACDEAQKTRGRFLSRSEVFQVFWLLGYRKEDVVGTGCRTSSPTCRAQHSKESNSCD